MTEQEYNEWKFKIEKGDKLYENLFKANSHIDYLSAEHRINVSVRASGDFFQDIELSQDGIDSVRRAIVQDLQVQVLKIHDSLREV